MLGFGTIKTASVQSTISPIMHYFVARPNTNMKNDFTNLYLSLSVTTVGLFDSDDTFRKDGPNVIWFRILFRQNKFVLRLILIRLYSLN